jgi:serine/threonine-protein kinase
MLESSFVWVDRTGAAQPIAAAPAASYRSPRLSPDGQRIAVSVRRATPRSADIWVYDATRGAPTRLTFNGGHFPVWSPDGKRIAFFGNGPDGSGPDASGIFVTNADGSGKPERLGGTWGWLSSWSGAANAITFARTAPGGHELWVLPLDGDRKPRLFLESRFELYFPTFSPDGHWIAYTSTESGAPELYVQPYPGPGEKIRVSTAGAFDPIWPANGRELLYRSFSRVGGLIFFSAPIPSLAPFRVDAPRVLFEAKTGVYDTTSPERSWDIAPEGQRFLISRTAGSVDKPVTSIDVVLNWTEELKRLVPRK